jgi:hypothetical protein
MFSMDVEDDEKQYPMPKPQGEKESPLQMTIFQLRSGRRSPRIIIHCVVFLSLFLIYHALTYEHTRNADSPDGWVFDAFGYDGPHRDPANPSRTQLKEKLFL